MAKYKNTTTGRVVEIADTAPDLDKIKHDDPKQQKALREIRARKYAQTLAGYQRSTKWKKVADNTKITDGQVVEAAEIVAAREKAEAAKAAEDAKGSSKS